LPNIKIYVNESVLTVRKPELIAALEPLREMIIGHLDVPKSACQLAIVSIVGLEDEPALNVEMHVMPGGKRTQKSLEALGAAIQGAYSGVIRPLIPKVSGHRFRFYPATDSGASGHPVM
jgi:hypothetical protein